MRLFFISSIIIIILASIVSANLYPTEYKPLGELTEGIISKEEAQDIAENFLEDIKEFSLTQIGLDSENMFYKITYSLYSHFSSVGDPKLIFDEEKALVYVAPFVLDSGEIGGFLGIDPQNGEIVTYPSWINDGQPIIYFSEDKWNNLEGNIIDLVGLEDNAESRLIKIDSNKFISILYLAVPLLSNPSTSRDFSILNLDKDPREVIRVGITSIGNLTPRIINQTPKVGYKSKQKSENGDKTMSIKSLKDGGEEIYPPDTDPDLSVSYLIPAWDDLPFKNQRATETWAKYANDNLNTVHNWDENFDDLWDWFGRDGTTLKCLSYAASTVSDWWNLEHSNNIIYNDYKSYIRYAYETGTNPRDLEARYHYRHDHISSSIYSYAPYLSAVDNDPVTHEYVPYSLEGYAKILTDPPDLSNYKDPEFNIPLSNPYYPDFFYSYWHGKYGVSSYNRVSTINSGTLIDALLNNGIIYAQEDSAYDWAPGVSGIHTVSLVGYGTYKGKTVFIIHDNYGYNPTNLEDYSSYKVIEASDVNEAWYFNGTPFDCSPYNITYSQNVYLDTYATVNWKLPCFTSHTNLHVCRPGTQCYPNYDFSTSTLIGENGNYQDNVYLDEVGLWRFFIHARRFGSIDYYSQIFQITVGNPVDSDGDSISDTQDKCPSTYGTYCNGCPEPDCAICKYAYCPANSAPYCKNSPASIQCGNDYYDYSCHWGNDLGDDTAKRLNDYNCNGLGSCQKYTGNWVVDESCSNSQYCYGSGISTNDADYYCKNCVITCSSDSECDDSDSKTEDSCVNPGACNSYCENTCIEAWHLNYGICQTDDKKLKYYTDSNSCGTTNDRPSNHNAYVTCNYCTSAYEQSEGQCQTNDKRLISYSYTNNCCSETGLSSDCNKPVNYYEDCDYCTSTWDKIEGECQPDNQIYVTYSYTNNCCEDTGLDSDCNKPQDGYEDCDYQAEQTRMKISEIKVEVDGKDETIDKGEEIRKEAEPGSEVEFDIEVENLYTRDEDISLEDVEFTVTIDDIDDGDELEEEEEIGDIRPGRKDSESVEFDIPLEVDEDEFDVTIEVTGKDENGNNYEETWELILEVEKDKHNVEIIKAGLDPEDIRCGEISTLDIDILNLGSEDEDDLSLKLENNDLHILFQEQFDLDEAPDDDAKFSKSFDLLAPKGIESDIYPISIKVYDGDMDMMDDKELRLTVDCPEEVEEPKTSTKKPKKTANKTEEQEEDVILVPEEPIKKENLFVRAIDIILSWFR